MWDVSSTYTNLMADDHYFEFKVELGGETFTQDDLISISTEYKTFEEPTVGLCLSSELTLSMFAPDITIPRMGTVRPYVRVTNGTTYSEWIPQGVFYIDTREITNNDDGLNVLTLHCYDAILKAEADYPGTSHSWPETDINVVKEIAYTLGLQASASATTGIDSRTISLMTSAYSIGLPTGTMRETLGYIAALYAGNWIMNYNGQLLLIPLNGLPDPTFYLIDENGSAITFGGVRILV